MGVFEVCLVHLISGKFGLETQRKKEKQKREEGGRQRAAAAWATEWPTKGCRGRQARASGHAGVYKGVRVRGRAGAGVCGPQAVPCGAPCGPRAHQRASPAHFLKKIEKSGILGACLY